jgi:uncharacterized protein YcbK (DUF882 family)
MEHSFKPYVTPPSRPFSQSEIKELSLLIRDYVDNNPKATDTALMDGIDNLSQLFDWALQLRYAKRSG